MVLLLGALAGHLAGLGLAAPPPHLDGRALQRHGTDGHLVAPLYDERDHLDVEEALHRLPIHVGDQVACPQAGLKGWAVTLHRLQRQKYLRLYL